MMKFAVLAKIRVLAIAALALAAGVGAQQVRYVITDSDGKFTVKRNNNVVEGAADTTMAYVLEAIRLNSFGDPIAIQLGADDGVLDVGENLLNFGVDFGATPGWGDITIVGSVKGSGWQLINFGSWGERYKAVVSIDAVNTVGGALYAGSSGIEIVITGGNYETVGDIITGRDASITIEDGVFSSVGRPVAFNGPLVISDGTFTSTGNAEALNMDWSSATITGGKFTAGEDASAANLDSATISGTAEFVNASAEKPTINIGSGTIGSVKVTNTGGGAAINISADSWSDSFVALTGAPAITGSIIARHAGRIAVDSNFAPGTRKYKLKLFGTALGNSVVAVTGGAAHLARFELDNPPYSLAAENGNIVVKLPAGFVAPKYTIYGDSASLYIAVRNGDTLGAPSAIEPLLAAVAEDADMLPCVIQFGDGTTPVDIGTTEDAFNLVNNAGTTWSSTITITGKLAGSVNPNKGDATGALLRVPDGTSIHNTADLINRDTGGCGLSISHNTSVTHESGRVSAFYSYGGLIIKGGRVNRVGGGSGASLEISGGVIGDSAAAVPAVRLNGSNLIVSGNPVIFSFDTTGAMTYLDYGDGTGTPYRTEAAGTIAVFNQSVARITGGTVANYATGYAILNNSENGRVQISGGTVTSKNPNQVYNDGGTIQSIGYLDITGGTVENTGGGTAILAFMDSQSEDFVPMLSISGTTANITSRGTLPTVKIRGNGQYVYNSSNGIHTMTSGGVAEISGGKITNTFDSATVVSAPAVETNNFIRLIISGTADITSRATNNMPIGTYSSRSGTITTLGASELHVLGGKITTTADSGVAVSYYAGPNAQAGRFFIGGSPVINGLWLPYGSSQLAPQIITAGDNAFTPGDNVISFGTFGQMGDNALLLTDGARFIRNFNIVTVANEAAVASNDSLKLAASGNTVVATRGRTYNLTFNLNDGTHGTPPPPIAVVEDARLGPSAMPPTAHIVNSGSYANDGLWYRNNGFMNGEWIMGEPFSFSTGNEGTRVTANMTLILNWTDIIIKVAESAREIAAGDADGDVAVVVPISPVTTTFTAGPNPAFRASGAVNFYRSGGSVTGGKLTIYDASGNVVRRINVDGNVTTWDLKDARGRAVAVGTYLVRGTVVDAGSGRRERVAVMVGVR